MEQDIYIDTPWDDISPSGYTESAGIVRTLPDGTVEIFAPRPVDEHDWIRLHALGHELCHAACDNFEDKPEYRKKDFSILRRI
jgi:hypothetical protein